MSLIGASERADLGEYALQADRITVKFGGLLAVSNVSFGVRRHETVGLIGPNGAGKTTAVNILSGMLKPTSGAVMWKGKAQTNWRLGVAARSGVVRTFQGNRVFRDLSVWENLRIAKLASGRGSGDLDELLSMLNLGHRRAELASKLPFGESRRLGVALALATDPEVVLLDEPGAGLTGGDLDMLGESINAIAASGKAVLLVDHNMGFVMGTVDRVVVMEGGQVLAEGLPKEIQQNQKVLEAYLGRSTSNV